MCNLRKKKFGGWYKRGGWKIFMKLINVEGGFFYGGWNFSKSVSVGPTFIREMRVCRKGRKIEIITQTKAKDE